MGFIRTLLVSLLALQATAGHFDIPVVDAIVHEVLATHEEYVHFKSNASGPAQHVARQSSDYWYENINHQGVAPWAPSGYQVFRNVKSYGAKGDGVTDDTAAINAAISAGGRCGAGCSSSTTTPAVVYLPAGTYLISSSIQDLYFTQIIGDPNSPPVLKATANFQGFGLIDGDHYDSANLRWGSTNVFFRQVRNLVLDTTNIPANQGATGIHWPTAQATSLQNVVFNLAAGAGTQHVGLFCESGSAGFMTDLTFNGGMIGAQVGNQQFTMRNLVFNNCGTAIQQLWDWGWLYQGLSINNCGVGIDISAVTGTGALNVGSVTVIDSTFTNTPVAILTAWTSTSQPPAAGSLILENVNLNNVATAVQYSGTKSTLLAGTSGSMNIAAWGEGHEYTPSGPTTWQGTFTPTQRPGSLLNGANYYTRTKPQYNTLSVSAFLSVRSAGAKGDGSTDDTAALQSSINGATSAGQIVFVDAGTYKVTSTLHIPPGAKIVGEAYSVIMSSGSFFNDMSNPQPVVQVGSPGQGGQVEWSDMIVSTQGQQAGAILIEWNLAASSGAPSGMWDVHARVGGFTGSDQQVALCQKNPGSSSVNDQCIVSYMSMHVTPGAAGLYMENCWLWTADHDIDDQANTQISAYAGRGLLIESTAGNIWLYGTAVEHHVMYQYQFANTQNIFAGFMQTETPYYQPNPPAPAPFTVNAALNDPDFSSSCNGQSGNCAEAWGLRVLNSKNILVYGAGLYSFFNNYDATQCSVGAGPENCQTNILSLEGSLSNIDIYCLSTVGTTNMIVQEGKTVLVKSSDNVNVYPDTIALFQLGSTSGTSSSPPPPQSSITAHSSAPASSQTYSSVPSQSQTATTFSTATSAPAPSSSSSFGGWTPLGCYTDGSSSGRTLPNSATVPGGASNMTIENCQAACRALGYSLVGLEYAQECWCGNSSENGGVPATDGCTMPCTGNAGEICGGSWRLNVFSYGASASSTPTRASTPSSSSTPSPAAKKWSLLGCYTDSVSARTLSVGMAVPGGAGAITVEACQSACQGAGYSLAGVEYAQECYCDSQLRNGGGPAPDGNAGCDMACTGNGGEMCGGPNRLELYQFA